MTLRRPGPWKNRKRPETANTLFQTHIFFPGWGWGCGGVGGAPVDTARGRGAGRTLPRHPATSWRRPGKSREWATRANLLEPFKLWFLVLLMCSEPRLRHQSAWHNHGFDLSPPTQIDSGLHIAFGRGFGRPRCEKSGVGGLRPRWRDSGPPKTKSPKYTKAKMHTPICRTQIPPPPKTEHGPSGWPARDTPTPQG